MNATFLPPASEVPPGSLQSKFWADLWTTSCLQDPCHHLVNGWQWIKSNTGLKGKTIICRSINKIYPTSSFFPCLASLPLWQHSMTKPEELYLFIWEHTTNFTVACRSLLNKFSYETDVPSSFSWRNSRGRKIKEYSDLHSLTYAYDLLVATAFRKFTLTKHQ